MMPGSVQGQVSYLSSAQLMSLQMGDPALRRTFLVQALIMLHACQHPFKKEKDMLRGKQVCPPALIPHWPTMLRHVKVCPPALLPHWPPMLRVAGWLWLQYAD